MKLYQSSTPVDIPVDIFKFSPSAELYGLKMSTGISTGVDDWPCLTTFYCYDPYWF